MAGFFQLHKPRQFDYKPLYYSEQKERIDELKRKLGEDAASEEARADRMREAFELRRPNTRKRKGLLKQSRLLIYILLLAVLIMLITNVSWLVY